MPAFLRSGVSVHAMFDPAPCEWTPIRSLTSAMTSMQAAASTGFARILGRAILFIEQELAKTYPGVMRVAN